MDTGGYNDRTLMEIDPFILGAAVGAGLVLLLVFLRGRSSKKLQDRLLEEIKPVFDDLSRKALSDNRENLEANLEAKKQLIDQAVTGVKTQLGDLGRSQAKLEGTLSSHVNITTQLQSTTTELREALANPQRRGQWGQRMAEDILQLAGFVEGVNYFKQMTTESGERPDYTFRLPEDRKVNMDVKFPLPNYIRYLDASDDASREEAKKAFLRDVRSRIKEVTKREYIDPEGGTVDYVLVFIPNEQVYGFIHEHDSTLLDDALMQKVVLCSPLTLYAILAVIRQVAEQHCLQQTSGEILSLLGAFNKQWGLYTAEMDKMGDKLGAAVKHYEQLTKTRTRQLERHLDKIEDLRTDRQAALPPDAEAPAPP